MTAKNDNPSSPEAARTPTASHGFCVERLVGLYGRLIDGHIIGCIDAYGAVHSEFTGDDIGYHSEHFPQQTHRLWRWNNDKSIHWFTSENRLNAEETEAVRAHMTRKYGLKWFENGFHDWEHLQTRAKAEALPNKPAEARAAQPTDHA